MSSKSYKIRRFGVPSGNTPESSLEDSQSADGAVFQAKGPNFVRLGKNVAPVFDPARDRVLVRLAQEGHAPDEIARQGHGAVPEITIRLVELCLGPLGRIRPAATEPLCGPFEDQPVKSAPPVGPDRQKPVLSLAACALGESLQRLGDRLYLDGRETPLPQVVREARNRGVRIRYPRIDPMEEAWRAGPSRKDSGRDIDRRAAMATPWDILQ